MKFISLLFLVSLLLVEYCRGLDIQRVLDKVYDIEIGAKGYREREKEFISQLWQKLSKLVPKSVLVPRFRENVAMHSYLCSYGTAVSVKVGNAPRSINFNEDRCDLKSNCIETSIEAQLHFGEPVRLEIYKEDPVSVSGKAVSYVLKDGLHDHISFLFNENNIIKFWVRTPDFSKARTNLPTDCYVNIDSVEIEMLSEPEFDETSKLGEQFWNSVKDQDIYSMLNVGIMKTMLDVVLPSTKAKIKRLFNAEAELFCLSNEFNSNIIRYFSDHSEGVFDKLFESQTGKKTGMTIAKDGRMTYEKFNTAQYISFIQFGIADSVTHRASLPKSDSSYNLIKEEIVFTSNGESNSFITYAPLPFSHLREIFHFEEHQYVKVLCDHPLKEISNPGKSGSGLYLSHDKYFIVKTIQVTEATFLVQRFLTGYTSHIQQNLVTLLPKFFGLYEYKENHLITGTSIRFLVMNNLMPSDIRIDQKYDLKGSTFEREASENEKAKTSTTYKDNDFTKHHSYGIFLKGSDYDNLIEIIEHDSKVLEKFQIIDYSLLLGLHYKDRILTKWESDKVDDVVIEIPCEQTGNTNGISTETSDDSNNDGKKQSHFAPNGIPALTAWGDKLLLYVGIIDMLQTYGLKKKFENFWKSKILNDDGISVVEPNFYASRFVSFMKNSVFKRMSHCPPGESTIKVRRKLKDWFKLL